MNIRIVIIRYRIDISCILCYIRYSVPILHHTPALHYLSTYLYLFLLNSATSPPVTPISVRWPVQR